MLNAFPVDLLRGCMIAFACLKQYLLTDNVHVPCQGSSLETAQKNTYSRPSIFTVICMYSNISGVALRVCSHSLHVFLILSIVFIHETIEILYPILAHLFYHSVYPHFEYSDHEVYRIDLSNKE